MTRYLKAINVLMCIDKNMFIPMVVSIASMAYTLNYNEKINVFIINSDIAENYREHIADNINTQIDFHWIDVNDSGIELLAGRNPHNWAPIAYYRFLLGELLPDEVNRVVYLDADTLVCRSISDLYHIDMEDFIIGAAVDLNRPWIGMQPGCVPGRNQGIPADAPYFNSGVMIIDVEGYRSKKIGKLALSYANQYAEKLEFADQDALNVALYDRWKMLDPRWNQVSSIHFDYGIAHCRLSTQELYKLRRNPYIIHYTGALPRPWIDPVGHPLASRWIEMLKLTAFSDYQFSNESRNNKNNILKRFKRALSILFRG